MEQRSRFALTFCALPVLAGLLFSGLVVAGPAHADRRDNGDGTVTDVASSLTWVVDPDFAADLGVPRWTSLGDALALLRAMNAGEVENFGRRDWRLPTARERSILDAADPASDGVRRIAARAMTGPGLVELRPVSGSALVAGIADATVVATNSVLFSRNVQVIGDVVANEVGGGPLLVAGWPVAIDRDASIDGDVAGDRVRLDRGVTVTGVVAANSLSANKATVGSTSTPLALPVFSMLPPFAVTSDRPGATAFSVAPGDTVELPAGHALDVSVAGGGTLILTGGEYHVTGLELAVGARLLFRAATALRLDGRLAVARGAEIGPEDGSGATAGDAILYIGGIDGDDGLLGSLPRAVEVERQALLRVNLYAPQGTVRLGQGTTLEGSILARDVLVDRDCELTLASYWGNRPPVADPQTVATGGAASIDIILSGSDPEGGDLSFGITDPPALGTLSTPTPIVPPTGIHPITGLPVQPPVTRASVTYVPATTGDLEDGFTFEVTDPLGSFGSARVTINPPAVDNPPPPPPTTVVVEDLSGTVLADATGIVTLTGAAPDGVDLVFSILAGSGPHQGTLGPLVAGAGAPVRTAAASYTPAPGFVGSDGFGFEACGIVSGVPVCDQAVVTLEVVASPVEDGELAEDRQVAAFEDVPVEIDLLSGFVQSQGGSATTTESGVRRITGRAVGITSAAIAGNVADADGDGLGDEHNALPGSVPGLISAGVDQSGGAGSNGTVRIHVEYDVSGLAGIQHDLASANVHLSTRRGTVDSLDTFFWAAGDDGNGTLEATDFERPAESIAGIVMPVPPTQAVGEDGSFSFGVLTQLQAALAAGHDYLTIQGRVDESLAGPARGLQVYSSASGNVTAGLVPSLSFSTPPPSIGLLVTITALPQFGTLFDSNGQAITVVPTTLPDSRVTYVPNPGFVGGDSFTYEVTDFASTDTGLVTVVVQQGSCLTSPLHCDDGR